MTTTNAAASGRRAEILDWVGLVLRLVVAGVFLGAGIPKAMNLYQTREATRAYKILPYELADAFGTMLPFVEIVAAALLLVGLLTRFSAVIITLMMIAFIIGISSAWARGLQIDCGCFGGGGPTAKPAYGTELVRDALLLFASGWLVVRPSSKFSLDRALFG